MKLTLFVVLWLFCGYTSGTPENIRENLNDELKSFIRSTNFLSIFKDIKRAPALTLSHGQRRFNSHFDPEKAPIIPVFPEPVLLPDGEYKFNITDNTANILFGDISLWNQTVEGLSAIEDALALQIACQPTFGLTATFDLRLPSVYIRGNYDTALKLFLYDAQGNGQFHIGLVNTALRVTLTLGITSDNTIQISGMALDLLIGKLDIFGENFDVEGFVFTPEDWEVLSDNLRDGLETIWPTVQEDLSNFVTVVVNSAIEDCTIGDYLEFIIGTGNLSCLKIPSPSLAMGGDQFTLNDFGTELVDFISGARVVLQTRYAQSLARTFLTLIFERIAILEKDSFRNLQAREPIFPEIPDPAYLNDSNTEIDLGFLLGNLSMQNGMLSGMSTVDDDLSYRLSLVPFGVIVNLTLTEPGNKASVALNGTHTSEFHLNIPPISPMLLIKSAGMFNFGIREAFLGIGLRIALQVGSLTKIEVKEFSLNMGFDELMLNVEELYFGDCLELPVDWKGIGDLIKVVFEFVWTANPRKDIIEDYIKQVINSVLMECTVTNIVDFIQGRGDLDCLSPPEFPGLPTTTTAPPVTTPTTTASSGPPVTTPTTAASSGPPVTTPTTTASSGPPVTTPTTTTSPGSPVTTPTTPVSSGPTVTTPTTTVSSGSPVTTPTTFSSEPSATEVDTSTNPPSPSTTPSGSITLKLPFVELALFACLLIL